MSFDIKSITCKNFLSVGNQTQAVDFDKEHLTLVLGENIDLGGDDSGSRNGVGKTTIINALSYALYGQALTNIRKENLINKTNAKNMLVTVEFEVSNINYRIERGRRPNVLKLYINNEEQKTEKNSDDAQGDSRETQKHIEQLLGMSHTMFKHLVALNTYTEPFLSMGASDQRDIIEQLLGITVLSEKAENLKSAIKIVKDDIQSETFKIEGIKAANENVQKSITSLGLKSSAWNNKKEQDLKKLNSAILHLNTVDIEAELLAHAEFKQWNTNAIARRDLIKQQATLLAAIGQAEKAVKKYADEINALGKNKCPSCDQKLQDHKHEEMLKKANKDHSESLIYEKKVKDDLEQVEERIKSLGELPKPPETFYESESEAMGHKNNLENLEKELESKFTESNPYDEQIEELTNTALQEISWDNANALIKVREHQEFLLKLLTNKDSFIRKRIIDQNLSHLNKRLIYYTEKMGLPHRVVFQNDLAVEITQLGQELDFDNLSRGERNRLILGLSFAFRDVWENLYQHINLLFVDELIDSGLDSSGVEAGLSVLKKMARERNKNIFLISHRDDLIGRVSSVLRVTKENGFTTFDSNPEYMVTK
jgi:DNA repair exonuclease SbcCD ATPase subunit